MTPLLLAALAASGVVLILAALDRARQRSTTMRRVAVLVGVDAGRLEPLPSGSTSRRIRLRLTQLVGRVGAHDDALRGPAVALAVVSALIGLGTVSLGWLIVAGGLALAAYALNGRARRRQRVESQALSAMQLLASGLRAGYSVPQAIALVARESPEPTAAEFSLAAQEISVGVGLADAVRHMAQRTANSDYELVSIIVRVQHEVGGNLAQILDSVSETLRERFELRRQVQALTSQQRLSSAVLSILPFALLLLLFVMDRQFVAPLFNETAGRVLLALAGLMVFIGWSIMRSIGRVDV
ncbi:MAG TPA: type II secretion system F family protein [Chloroflexota bacterium]|jgi:tight adherence protein B